MAAPISEKRIKFHSPAWDNVEHPGRILQLIMMKHGSSFEVPNSNITNLFPNSDTQPPEHIMEGASRACNKKVQGILPTSIIYLVPELLTTWRTLVER